MLRAVERKTSNGNINLRKDMTGAMDILQRPNVKMPHTKDVPQTRVACMESNQCNDWANSVSLSRCCVLVMSIQGLPFIFMYQKLVIRVNEYTKVTLFLRSLFTMKLWYKYSQFWKKSCLSHVLCTFRCTYIYPNANNLSWLAVIWIKVIINKLMTKIFFPIFPTARKNVCVWEKCYTFLKIHLILFKHNANKREMIIL